VRVFAPECLRQHARQQGHIVRGAKGCLPGFLYVYACVSLLQIILEGPGLPANMGQDPHLQGGMNAVLFLPCAFCRIIMHLSLQYQADQTLYLTA
jgi:hypothetical protein